MQQKCRIFLFICGNEGLESDLLKVIKQEKKY